MAKLPTKRWEEEKIVSSKNNSQSNIAKINEKSKKIESIASSAQELKVPSDEASKDDENSDLIMQMKINCRPFK